MIRQPPRSTSNPSSAQSDVYNRQSLCSVWPSVWGWHVMEKRSFVPTLPHNVLRKWLRNLMSRSKAMLLGSSWRRTTSLKNNSATWHASSFFSHGMKCVIFENLMKFWYQWQMSYRMSRHHASEHGDYIWLYELIKQVNNTSELLTQFGATSPTSGGSQAREEIH